MLWGRGKAEVAKKLPRSCLKARHCLEDYITGCWCGCPSGAKCKWFAYGPPDVTITPSSLASLKSRMFLPFWYRLTQVVLEKRPWNGCSTHVGEFVPLTWCAWATAFLSPLDTPLELFADYAFQHNMLWSRWCAPCVCVALISYY